MGDLGSRPLVQNDGRSGAPPLCYTRAVLPGCVDMWDQRVQVIAPLGRVGMHAHAATVLLVGLDGAFSMRPKGSRCWLRATSFLIPAGCTHALECGDRRIGALFFAPGPADQRSLRERWKLSTSPPSAAALAAPAALLREALRARVRAAISPSDLTQVVSKLLGPADSRPLTADPRLNGILTDIITAPDAPVRLADAAEHLGLSPSRLRDLARLHAGTSLQSFRRWQRMRLIAAEVAAGRSLTAAAHSLGFTDSAQLSRDFRAAFGIPPSRVLHPSTDIRLH